MQSLWGSQSLRRDNWPILGDLSVLAMEAHRIARVRVARGQVALEREDEASPAEGVVGEAPPDARAKADAGDLPREDTATAGADAATAGANVVAVDADAAAVGADAVTAGAHAEPGSCPGPAGTGDVSPGPGTSGRSRSAAD